MKKYLFPVLLMFLGGITFAVPSIKAGIGGCLIPGQYDYSLISLYIREKNNDNISNVDLSEIKPAAYSGFNIFAEFKLWNFMVKPQVSLSFPSKITVTYIDSSSGSTVPYSIEHKGLFIMGTTWLGPVMDLTGKSSIYLLAGPSFMYGEWRDKIDVENNTDLSRDRQYRGMGVTIPVMFGAESAVSERIGISLEVILIAQQILLETFSIENLSSSDSTYNIITFPAGSGISGVSVSPAIFMTQLSLVYRIW